MKAGPSPATLFAVERVILPGEELTAAEVAERAGMSTGHARGVLATLAGIRRVRIVDGGMVGDLRLSLYARDEPAPEPEETITAGRFTIRTRDPQMKAVLRELDATARELELVRTMREYRTLRRMRAAGTIPMPGVKRPVATAPTKGTSK